MILTIAPIAAGVDKFLHLLVNWDKYASPLVARFSPLPVHTVMLAVGVIEVAAGITSLRRSGSERGSWRRGSG